MKVAIINGFVALMLFLLQEGRTDLPKEFSNSSTRQLEWKLNILKGEYSKPSPKTEDQQTAAKRPNLGVKCKATLSAAKRFYPGQKSSSADNPRAQIIGAPKTHDDVKSHCKSYSCSRTEYCGQRSESNVACHCDAMCWIYGDCCFDFYEMCLGENIRASTQQLLSATLQKLTTLDDVYNFREEWRLAHMATCTTVHHNNGKKLDVQMISECSPQSKEIFHQLLQVFIDHKRLMDRETDDEMISFLADFSEDEIVRECERNNSAKSKCERSTCIFLDLEDKEYDVPLVNQIPVMHDSLRGVNFKNVFCGVCNGVHTALLKRWTISQSCQGNLNITLLSRASNLGNIGCNIDFERPINTNLRFCINVPDDKDKNQLNNNTAHKTNHKANSNTEITSGTLDNVKACANSSLPPFESLLCNKYILPFTCNHVLHQVKNPHCFDKFLNLDASDKSASIHKIYHYTFLSCPENFQCVGFSSMQEQDFSPIIRFPVLESALSGFPNAPSFRILLDFRRDFVGKNKISTEKAAALQCPSGQTYLHFYERCQPIVCGPGFHVEGQRCVHNSDSIKTQSNTGSLALSSDSRLPFQFGPYTIKLIITVKPVLPIDVNWSRKEKTLNVVGEGDVFLLNEKYATKTEKKSREQQIQNKKERRSGLSTENLTQLLCKQDSVKGSPVSFQNLSSVWVQLQNELQPISLQTGKDNLDRFLHSLNAVLCFGEAVDSFDERISILLTLSTNNKTINCDRFSHLTKGTAPKFQIIKLHRSDDSNQSIGSQVFLPKLNVIDTKKDVKSFPVNEINDNFISNHQLDSSKLCISNPHSNSQEGYACIVISLYMEDPSLFDSAFAKLCQKLAFLPKLSRSNNIVVESLRLTNMAEPYNHTITLFESPENLALNNFSAENKTQNNVRSLCHEQEDTITKPAKIKLNSNKCYEVEVDGYTHSLSQIAFSSDVSISDVTRQTEFTYVSVAWCAGRPTILNCNSSTFVKFNTSDFILYNGFIILTNQKENTTKFLDSNLNTTETVTAISIQKVLSSYKRGRNKQQFKKEKGEDRPIRVFDKKQYELTHDGALVCIDSTQSPLNVRSWGWQFNYKPSSLTEQIATIISNTLSIVCLALVLFVYSTLSELRNTPGLVVMSLSITLLLAQLLFLLCLYPARISSLFCQVYAAVHHASWLAAFFWLACMAVNLVRLVHFGTRSTPGQSCSRIYTTMAAVCWGVPFCAATLCFFLDYYGLVVIGYGRAGVCWIGNRMALVYTFVAPLLIIIFISVFCCVLVVRTVLKSAAFRQANTRAKYSTGTSTQSTNSMVNTEVTSVSSACKSVTGSDSNVGDQVKTPSKQSGRRNQALMCVHLSLLMGGNWIFYLAASVMKDQNVLWILTTIFSGSQGLFLFLCFVAKRSLLTKVYDRWKCK